MEQTIYGLCALTAFMCAWLLLQAYRRTKYGLLFWTGLFFAVATISNVVLIFDKVVYPEVDLTPYRYAISLLGLCILLPGLIFEKG